MEKIISTDDKSGLISRKREKQIDSAPFAAFDDIVHRFALLQKRMARATRKTEMVLRKGGRIL
jgi:hypothetical protein